MKNLTKVNKISAHVNVHYICNNTVNLLARLLLYKNLYFYISYAVIKVMTYKIFIR